MDVLFRTRAHCPVGSGPLAANSKSHANFWATSASEDRVTTAAPTASTPLDHPTPSLVFEMVFAMVPLVWVTLGNITDCNMFDFNPCLTRLKPYRIGTRSSH